MKVVQYGIIDSHGHMGPIWNYYIPYNSGQAMLDNMDHLGFEATVISSILALCGDPELGNRYTLEACRKFPGRFLGHFSVNPHYPELNERDIPLFFAESCIVGFKAHPELSGDYPLDGKGYEFMFRYASEHKIPILSHTYYGGDRLDVFEALAKEYPDAPLIIGHGALDLGTQKAIDLCNRYPSLYYDLCSPVNKRFGPLNLVIRELDPDKVLFGTDAPSNDPAYSLGSVMFCDATEEVKRKWFRDNFLRLYHRAPKALSLKIFDSEKR